MRGYASSFGAWRSLERQEGIKKRHGLVSSLATVAAIGEPHGLRIFAEEEHAGKALEYDAVFVSVLDTRCMVEAGKHFGEWTIPLRRCDRRPVGRYPLVWCGGQGLHNPMPMSAVFDLCIIGDAEEPLPELLCLWERHGNTEGFLAAASTVGGVYVPDHHDPSEATVVQAVTRDVSVSLRQPIVVTHDGSRRIEIARGCRYKCAFCGLGWRAPVRENSVHDVIAALQCGPRRVHLQAGDAESYSEIGLLRAELARRGVLDLGWTGRIDTIGADRRVSGQKRFAFGVEGVSYRLRRAVGKGSLTDEHLVANTCAHLESIEGDGKGRAAWHIICGLPTERPEETLELMRVMTAIDERLRGTTARNLSVHCQPLQPIPGTPMQWCGAGSGTRRLVSMLRPLSRQPWCRARPFAGRTDRMAAICASLARSGEQAVELLEAMAERRVSPAEAEKLCGCSPGPMDPDAPLPWDWIDYAISRSKLRRAYDVTMRRLSGKVD